MPLSYESDQYANRHARPACSPHSANEVMTERFEATLDDQHALNDLIGLVELPQNCVPIGIDGYNDDLDTGAGLVVDIGILNQDKDDLVAGSELVDAKTMQAAGMFEMNSPNCAFKAATWKAQADAPTKYQKTIVAAKVVTAAAGAAAGKIYGNIYYREANFGA